MFLSVLLDDWTALIYSLLNLIRVSFRSSMKFFVKEKAWTMVIKWLVNTQTKKRDIIEIIFDDEIVKSCEE